MRRRVVYNELNLRLAKKKREQEGAMTRKYPLKLEPQLKEKVWGGRWLAEKLGRPANAGELLGESWEAFSGSVVMNGAWKGRTVGELYQQYGPEIGGEAAKRYPEFPLLVKFIDARENLSVQVHPDDALAQKLENYHSGKSEMWYIVAAEPGARILYGFNEKATSLDEIAAALKNETILDFTKSVPVQAGDVVNLPSRTVHALCEGIVVYELQQESDITYRLYDWGRKGREIHHEKGLQALNLEARELSATHPALQKENGAAHAVLVDGDYFTCELWEVSGAKEQAADNKSFTLLTAVEGQGQIVALDGSFVDEAIKMGDTFLLPAGLRYTLKAENAREPLRVITGKANI